jgi:DNA-binding MarR family transcriptional regulator
MTLKGELPLRLIAELGLEIELSHFSAMTAILRIESGVGHCMAQPATVGLLAEELGVDPSRASRTAADLIDKGYLVRTADQTDGRKIVLQQTELAKSTFRAIVDRKWQKMIGVFQDWSEADIAAFSTLFQRYSAEIRKVYSENG